MLLHSNLAEGMEVMAGTTATATDSTVNSSTVRTLSSSSVTPLHSSSSSSTVSSNMVVQKAAQPQAGA